MTAVYHGLSVEVDADYVAEMVRQEMIDRFGNAAYTDGYRVYTTVNSGRQKAAQRSVIDGLKNL